MLPVPGLGTGSVEIAGEAVAFHSLSRDDVVSLAALADDPNAAEVLILSRACGISEDEAREWRTLVDADTASVLLDAIAEVSGLGGRTASSGRSNGR